IELGKRDFFENTEVGLKRLRLNVAYFAVDADQLLAAKPDLAARLFREVEGLIEARVFRPLPYRAFPAEGLSEALRWMQRGRHVGKVVVAAPKAPAPAAKGLPVVRDGTYLVVGGFEGFGLETARWLARKGAGRLVLASRRGDAAPDADAALASVRALGAEAVAASLDVADFQAVARLLKRIGTKRLPLRGVVHSADYYADGMASEMTAESFAAAVRVKADGAAALDAATRAMAGAGRPIDFLVLYSSATTVLGNPGQANYVAGNAADEAIAAARQADGLPGMAVAWGPIRDTGALHRQAAVAAHLERQLG
ncbi:MAG: SDR family NAD(P)-dependent oxidoreductase, partial [Alphaproteobacteria bacterium]